MNRTYFLKQLKGYAKFSGSSAATKYHVKLHLFLQLIPPRSTVDQMVRLGIKGLLDQESPLGESLCCVINKTLYMLLSTVLTHILV